MVVFLSSTPSALLEIFLFLAAAEALRLRTRRFNVPPVIGELLLGMLLAPVALGGVINSVLHVPLFAVSDLLIAFSEFSVILLIFSAGLEGGISTLRSAGGYAILSAVAGNLIPFAITFIAFANPDGVFAFGGSYSVTTALLLAVAAGATSTAVVVSLIRESGLSGTRGGAFLLTTCALDDVVGLITLSAVLALVGNQLSFLVIAGTTTVTVLVWVGLLFASLLVIPRIFRLVGPEESRSLPFLILFALAAVVTYVGFSAIVGAFIAGLAVAESLAAPRARQTAEFLVLIFGALFFVVVGFQFDVRLLLDPFVLVSGLVLAAIAAGGKVVGVILPAHRRFPDVQDSVMVSVGMIPRGEIGLIVGATGIRLGLLPQTALGAIIVMAIATTAVGGVAFQRVAGRARRHHASEEGAPATGDPERPAATPR